MFNGLRNAIEISTTLAAFAACAWIAAGPVAGLVAAAIVAAVMFAERTRGAVAGLEAPPDRSHIGAAGLLAGRPVRSSPSSRARSLRP